MTTKAPPPRGMRFTKTALECHRFISHRRWFFALFICLASSAVFSAGALVSSPHAETVDVAAAIEPGEELPGGAATSRKSTGNRNAFSHPSGNLGFAEEFRFKIGNGMFKKLWVSAPASTKASDGLGPLFNARSCQRCHLKDGRGHPPSANWPDDDAVSMFLRLSVPPQNDADRELLASRKATVIGDPVYGSQLQDLSIQGHMAEGKMNVTYKEVPVQLGGGETALLRKPTYTVTHLGYGPLHKDVMLSPRVAPQMIGLGLLEAIQEQDILTNEVAQKADGNGISGRPNLVWSSRKDKVQVGRFGWKAGNATVMDQSAGAFAGDIGISSPVARGAYGECTKAQTHCRNAPNGISEKHDNAEISQKMLDLVVFYSQNLAVPKRRDPSAPDVLRGKKLFHQAGCAHCHRPSYVTGDLDGAPHLSKQKIWPYTDLLLHDMGDGLADNRPEGVASGREWKTPPLWGIGLTPVVSGHSFYLHDGRARNMLEAILWHGGEAKKARETVVQMSPNDRQALIRFLESL